MAQQIEQIDKPKFELIDFDANVFDAILQFLPLNDLAALAQTCTKFHREIDRHFSLKRKNEGYVRIYGGNDEISFGHTEPYQEQFQSLIKNVEVTIGQTQIQDLFEFIMKNCSKELRSLQVNNFGRTARLDGCETIAEQLSNVEILKLRRVRPDNIVNYCVNLRKLFLLDYREDQNYNWLNQVCPGLEMLCYPNLNDSSIDMNDFLRNHPHLKFFFCIGGFSIKSFCSTEADLSHVTIHLISIGDDVNILLDLERLCNQKFVKSLDIEIKADMCSNRLPDILNLNALRCIHLYKNMFDKPEILIGQTYPNIEMLCIKSFQLSLTNELQNCLKCFPNIGVLRINTFDDVQTEILYWIIANFPSLQHIYMKIALKSNFDMEKLNDDRAKLQNAKTVKIHLQRDSIQIDSMLWKKEFISIIPSAEIVSCPTCFHWDKPEKLTDYVLTTNSIIRDSQVEHREINLSSTIASKYNVPSLMLFG